MAEKKYISVRVNGRPSSNSGYQPLVMFNNPPYMEEDPTYIGFGQNSYFFTVRLTRHCAIYKFVRNNVYSNGGTRLSQLLLSFSIPPGYKLDGDVSPYDVLIDLFDVFASKYLSVRNQKEQSYEFNTTNAVDVDVLNEAALKYTLVPDNRPYHVMNATGVKGYITLPEDKISLLLRDVQYPEFKQFSEVILAQNYTATETTDTGMSTSYMPITGLEIPRKVEADNKVDGTSAGSNVEDITSSGDTKPANNVDDNGTRKDNQNASTQSTATLHKAEDPIIVEKESPVITIIVKINATHRFKSAKNARRLRFDVQNKFNYKQIDTVLSTDVLFSDINAQGIAEGRFYLPKTWQSYSLYFAYSSNGVDYRTRSAVDLAQDTITLTDADFVPIKKPLLGEHGKYGILAFALIAMFLLGGVAGCNFHAITKKLPETTEQAGKEFEQEIKEAKSNVKKKVDNKKQSKTSNGKSNGQ